MALEVGDGPKPDVVRERRNRSKKAHALVAALATGGPRRQVTIGDVELELRLIKGSEQTLATARAYAALEKSGLADKPDAKADLNRLLMIECLAFSIVAPGEDEPAFADGTELGSIVAENILGSLLLSYAELAAEGDLAMGDMLLRKEARDLLEKKSWTELSAIAPKLPRSSLVTTVAQLCKSLAQRS